MKTAVKGYWEETKEKLKERYSLSDEDFGTIEYLINKRNTNEQR